MASEVLIETNKLLEIKQQISNLKRQNEELKARVDKLKGSLEWKVAAKEGINSNLETIASQLTKQGLFLENAENVCNYAANNTEETNTLLIGGVSAIILAILGLGTVIGNLFKYFQNNNSTVIKNKDGNITSTVVNTGSGSTDAVPIVAPTPVTENTKSYQNSSLNYKGNDYSNYKVASSFDQSQVLSQVDPRWKEDLYMRNKDGSLASVNGKCPVNAGCCVTAEAMAYNMKHPNDPKTPLECNNGTGEKPNRGNSFAYFTGDYYSNKVSGSKGASASTQRNMIYQNINNNEPTLVRVGWGHTVTAVGIREGADPNNLTNADILVADPSGGKIKTLEEACKHNGKQHEIDTSWALYTPK